MTRQGSSASAAASRDAAAPAPGAAGWPLGAVFAVIVVALLAAYFPSLRGGLLWDDAGHVTSPALQSWHGLFRIWFEPGVTQQYYPLLHSAFWVEHRLWGDATLGYRLVNLLAHATSACLFIAVLRRLRVPGALLAGLLFALHPVCVESVAWIAEQKNTLSTVFYLAAALAWLRFEDDRRPARYAVATLWFVAALLTKTVTATLPAALLVIAWWRRGRLSWRGDVRPLLPWFAAGIGVGIFTAWFERVGIGAQGAEFNLSWLERGLLAGRVFWFYLGKLVWPSDLMFFYPHWHVDASAAWQYLFPAAALALLGTLVWWTRRGHGRGLLAAALLFGGTLFPVLGFLNVYPFVFSYVADHFQYLASLSFFALVAAGLASTAQRFAVGVVTSPRTRASLPRRLAPAFAAVLVGSLAVLTWRQSAEYVDPVTLYRATLARNADSWVAHHNLASELAGRGDLAGAVEHARRAVALKPDYPEALNNLADDLTQTGHADKAPALCEQALRLQPRYAQAENTWGVALLTLGRVDDGIRHLQHALVLDPALVSAHYNLGLAHAQRGEFAAAVPQFAATVRLQPDHTGAELNWGIALALSEGLTKARPHLDRAITLDPDSAVLYQTYGRVLANAGQLDDALRKFREAQEIDPALPGLDQDLASALHRLGRPR